VTGRFGGKQRVMGYYIWRPSTAVHSYSSRVDGKRLVGVGDVDVRIGMAGKTGKNDGREKAGAAPPTEVDPKLVIWVSGQSQPVTSK